MLGFIGLCNAHLPPGDNEEMSATVLAIRIPVVYSVLLIAHALADLGNVTFPPVLCDISRVQQQTTDSSIIISSHQLLAASEFDASSYCYKRNIL